jgi:hypothetical protein
VFCFASKLSLLNATPREKQEGKGINKEFYLLFILIIFKNFMKISIETKTNIFSQK